MPNIKYLDLKCQNCQNGILNINLTTIPQNFNCWQGVKCPKCNKYNDFRMRKVAFYKFESQQPTCCTTSSIEGNA